MQTDFRAHPFLGIIARAALDDYRFSHAKDVTLSGQDRAITPATPRPIIVRAQQ